MVENGPDFEPHEPTDELSLILRGLTRVITPVKELREKLYYWACDKLGAEPNPEDLG